MYNANAHPNVLYICYKDRSLVDLLPWMCTSLETCQKSLAGYLESKRKLFPRFFFVSDAVLLDILGQGSRPRAMQPHLLSIFDNIAKVDFDETDGDCLKVFSRYFYCFVLFLVILSLMY